jgi:hypothetical protein
MKFEVYVGDRWDDGHGKFDIFVFETNASMEAIQQAITDMNENLDFGSWFQKYEWNKISSSQYAELIEYFPEASEYFEPSINWRTNEKTGDYSIMDGSEGYIQLWMALVKKYNPTIELKMINEGLPSIELGGYGLYH